MHTASPTGIVGEPTQLTAIVSVNEIRHTWDKVKEAQQAAVMSEIKLIQANLDFGSTLRRAESQMGNERLLEELEQQGIDEYTAKQAMKMSKDNPGGIAQIAADSKKLKQYSEQLTFPATNATKDEGVARDLPPWELGKSGLRLNENPDGWHKYGSNYSTDMFWMKTKDIARIHAELGFVQIVRE